MKRLSLALVVLAAVLALAGCGGGTRGQACRPGDYYMNCVRPPAPKPTYRIAPAVQHGVDFAWSCPSPAGEAFGASYYSNDPTKNWSPACVGRWHAARAATVGVFESSAARATQGFNAGFADAYTARRQARALGEPDARPIDYAVDCDCAPAAIFSYFAGADAGTASILHLSRPAAVQLVGIYGGYRQVAAMYADRLVGHTNWQTYAWSAGRWLPAAVAPLEQYLNSSPLDYDRAIAADYGQWPYTPPPTYPLCFSHRIPARSCAVARAKVAGARRAAASSQRAFAARGCPVLAQRIGWFASHLSSPPHARAAYRRAALAASRRAYAQRSCATFSQRVGWFAAAAARLQAAS